MEKHTMGKADLHIHSTFSYDGLSTPEAIIKTAANIGLDIIAITDHEAVEGAFKAQKYEKKYGVEVIVGEEILTNEGEILGLFLKEKIEHGKTLFETVKAIRDQDGLVVIPHPFSWFPLTRPPIGLKKLYDMMRDRNSFPDAIEVLNSTPIGRISFEKCKRVNEKIFNLAEVAGSDAHIDKHVGMGVTLFPGKTKEDLRKAILEKKTKITGGFISKTEHAEVIRKDIIRIGKSTGKKLLKPYYRLKESLNNRFNI
ncbi:hypothetical protein COZ97_02100 [bacterium CG_4_8_14_3_um_filter_33_28]|nr:MAG: hypothetical protein COU50_02440 [bacterium CG10_big_fil_rev_8_21_14_0_10_33_18]PIW81377.1 MAG: hypothetical protein COZ97_02100 [bacterium CG_4_8_14_3_um_filter_33_28]PJA72496.1 MAG: hypothetical protein CO152_01140 [bacterium CG_4_9_14_3_um_filter_33_26]